MAEKTYHTRIPNSTFIMQLMDKNGAPLASQVRVLQFHGKDYTTSDPEEQAQLDKVVDQAGSMIYENRAVDPTAALPANEVKQKAAEVIAKIAASGQHIS